MLFRSMYDGVALQNGTSHYFGDGFAKAFGIEFLNKENKLVTPFQTSWGVTTRMIGSLIMVHGDDRGLVIPPNIAPTKVMIIPIGDKEEITDITNKISDDLKNSNISFKVDNSNKTPGFKFAEAEVKGYPVRIEIGMRDLENKEVTIVRRDTLEKIKEILLEEKPKRILEIGTAIGYSACQFAKYTSCECIIDTIELDSQRAEDANVNIEKIGFKDRINVIQGNAVDILPTLKEKYDIIFIDAAKGKYPIFLEESLKLINKNGLILADNILYKGYVMSDYNKHKQRTAVRHLREYIKEITENKNMSTQILEVGDGLSITRIKNNCK